MFKVVDKTEVQSKIFRLFQALYQELFGKLLCWGASCPPQAVGTRSTHFTAIGTRPAASLCCVEVGQQSKHSVNLKYLLKNHKHNYFYPTTGVPCAC